MLTSFYFVNSNLSLIFLYTHFLLFFMIVLTVLFIVCTTFFIGLLALIYFTWKPASIDVVLFLSF